MKEPQEMTLEELKREIVDIEHFLENCDIDEDGNEIIIPEPSEALTYINEMMDRLTLLEMYLPSE